MGYFSKFNGGAGIPFMEGRNKQELFMLFDNPVHVEDYGFINGDDGDYAVFCVKEWPESFFFGNSVITDTFRQIDKDGMKNGISSVEMICYERASKKGRLYTAVKFVEKEEEEEETAETLSDDLPFLD